MVTRRIAIVGTIAGLVVAAIVLYSVVEDSPGKTYLIESGYAFDVTNPNFVAGYADDVIVGLVAEIVDANANAQRSLYAVDIQESLKGAARGRIVVSQLGYVDSGDLYVLEDQAMLQEGHTYLLAITTEDSGQHTVIGGPQAVVDLNSIDRDTLIRRWTQAVASQQYPPGVPRR